jgi:multidrug efflux pump
VIGLAAKNAILIVEFAKDTYDQGGSLIDATVEASRLRFRPILMTSLAFILGVTPLVLATGASSASQNAVGFGVVGGMLAATPLALLFVPTFFVVILTLFKTKAKPTAGHAHMAPLTTVHHKVEGERPATSNEGDHP